MDHKPEEMAVSAIGPLVLALAKSFHWAGLYGPDHPVLAKRIGEVHAALLSRLPDEPGGQLLLGVARDKVLYRNEFFGEGQELIVNLTESLYLRQVSTVGIDGRVAPEGLVALFRYLHETRGKEAAVPPEQFLRENGIQGISLSPYNYKELLSRKLAESEGKAGSDPGREEELWRLLITSDFADGSAEGKILGELSDSPEIIKTILRRAIGAGSPGTGGPSRGDSVSADVLKRLFGRIGTLVRTLPEERKREIFSSLEAGSGGDTPGEGSDGNPLDILMARSLTEEYSDDDFLDLLASFLSVEEKGGERLRNVFGIIASDRDVKGSLLPRIGDRAKESRRAKNYYDLKTWETVEKLLLSRSEEAYLESDHARFLESISAMRGRYLERVGESPTADPRDLNAFQPEAMRRRATLILLELLRSGKLEGEFSDLLEEVRKAVPNLISRKEIPLLRTALFSLDSISAKGGAERGEAFRQVILATDFSQIVDLYLAGGASGPDAEAIREILVRFGEAATPPILDLLLNEAEAGKRRSIIRLAVSLGPAAVPETVARMAHPKWYFVRNLCTILGEIGDSRGTDALMQAASHPDHRVKREAILAVGKLGAPEAVPGLGKILLEEGIFSSTKEDQVRIDAASALYRIGSTEAVACLHRGKGSRRQAVRSHCETLLRSLKEAP